MESINSVTVILIDHHHMITSDDLKLFNMLKSKFTETSLDFLHKETLLHLANRYNRKDFITLFPQDPHYILSLLRRSGCFDSSIDGSNEKLIVYQGSENIISGGGDNDGIDFKKMFLDFHNNEELVAELLIRKLIKARTVQKDKKLLERKSFIHRVAPHGYFLFNLNASEKEIAIQAIQQDAQHFNQLSKNLRRDRDIAKLAFSKCGNLILNSKFISDKEMVLIALENNGSVYTSITSDNLKYDVDVVNVAMKSYPELLLDLPHKFFDDFEFSLRAVKLIPSVFKNVPQRYDLNFVKKVMSPDIVAYLSNTDYLKDDDIRKQLECYFKKDSNIYTVSSILIRQDKQFALLVIEINPQLLRFVELQNYDCCKLAITKNWTTIQSCSVNVLHRHFDLIELAISLGGISVYNFLPNQITNNLDTMKKIIQVCPQMYSNTTKKMRENKELSALYYSLQNNNTVKTNQTFKFETILTDLDEFDFSKTKPFSLDTSSGFKFGSFSNKNDSSIGGGNNSSSGNSSIVNPFSSSINFSNPFSKSIPSQSNSSTSIKTPSLTLPEKIALSNDKEYLKQEFEKDPFLFQHCNEKLKRDKEFILELLKKHTGAIFQYVDDSLKTDKEFIMKAIPLSIVVSKFMDRKFIADKDIVILALKTSHLGYVYF